MAGGSFALAVSKNSFILMAKNPAIRYLHLLIRYCDTTYLFKTAPACGICFALVEYFVRI